ncbi:MROH1 protein, partial [Odontophorus gujanensis]|nr:MROH1 protein [Odontophorus gujanensis]
MEHRLPSRPKEAWPERPMVSASVVSPQEEDPLSCIQACCMHKPEAEAQKLSFLACVQAACEATLENTEAHDHLCACASTVAQRIEELLKEEPAECLDTELRQQAMHAISAMSSAQLLPETRKNGLLRACLSSVLLLPHHKNMKDWDAALYIKTMEALHHLLQVLVGNAGAFVLLELQNILELLLPFTACQQATVEKRAVACIARLLAFSNTCSLPKVCSCLMQAVVLQHTCLKNQRFSLLGKLAGHLILCCTSTHKRTRHEAMEAVRQLFAFISTTGRSLVQKDPKELWLQECKQILLQQEVSQKKRARNIFELLLKCLLSPERVDIFLTAVQSMAAPSLHSTTLAAHMVEVLAAEAQFTLQQLQRIVKAIYSSLPAIKSKRALKSLDRALLMIASQKPREMVRSMLASSPTCTSVAVSMWRAMLLKPTTVKKVLQELLGVLRNHSQLNMALATKDQTRVFALAATRVLSKIFQLPLVLKEAETIFPQLFLALLCQVSFTTQLTLQEIEVFWVERQQNQLTPIRSVVQSLKVLLCSVGFQRQVEAIQEQGGWDALLSTVTHLQGVQVVARVMSELPGALCGSIFRHVVELLSTSSCCQDTVAVVFLIEMLECVDLEEELLWSVVELFYTCLQRRSGAVQQLMLRGVLQLSKRQDMTRTMISFLPCIMEQLQDADSNIRATILLILSNLLPFLKGKELSFNTLELMGKLPALFNDESSTVRQLSIHLFLNTLSLVERREKKKMRKEVYRNLLPLCLHLHDEEECVVEASRKALLGAARFLRWTQLEHLVQTAQFCQIGKCMLARRRKSAAQDYLGQSLLYLQSPQEPLRQEAKRFI